MPKFIENAVMLYREGGEVELDGKFVEYQIFDQDDEKDFSAARADGWLTHSELFDGSESQDDEKSLLIDEAIKAGVIDQKTGKPATLAALGRWGVDRIRAAIAEA